MKIWTFIIVLLSCQLCNAGPFGQPYTAPKKQTVKILHLPPKMIAATAVSKRSYGNLVDDEIDSNEKWFVTVFTSPGCPPCVTLKRDLKNSPFLTKFTDGRRVIYSIVPVDSSEGRRLTKIIPVSSTPTIRVQLPMSGKFGNPYKVLFTKVGYTTARDREGAQRELRDDIIRAVKKAANGENLPPKPRSVFK